MRYLSYFLGIYSLDVGTFATNDSEFHVRQSVCLFAYFLTKISQMSKMNPKISWSPEIYKTGKSDIFGKSQECLQEISDKYLIQNWSSLYLYNFSKEISQLTLTDIQEIQNYLELLYRIPENFPRNFRNLYLPELELSLYLCNFSKEVSRLINWQTCKKFRFNWNSCANIPGVSPENFRKISLPELEIFLYLNNFSKEVSQLTDWQTYKKIRIIWN